MGIQDKIESHNQMAYILATAYHESKFGTPRYPRSVPLEEDSNPMRRDKNGLYRINHVTGRRINGGSLIAYFNDAYGNNKKLGNRRGTNDGYDFRGRGFVQLTGRSNYAKLSARLNEIGYNYTINGKTYGTRENPIDLLTNPDHVSRVPELSSIILVEGMKSGLYTGVGLDNFISSKSTDFFGARSIVNGDKNKIEQGNSRSNGQIIKGYADSFSIVLAKTWSYIIEVNKVGGGL